MSIMQARGGIPYVLRDSIATAGRKVRLPFYVSHLKIRNKGANICRLYFTEVDFTNDENYVEVPVASPTYPYGEWEGPVETTAGDHDNVWLRGVTAATAIELVAFQRRA